MLPLWSLHADPLEDVVETTTQSITNSATELLKQGAGKPRAIPD